MDVTEIRQLRLAHIGRIKQAIAESLAEFQQATGVHVSRVSVDLVTRSTMGQPPVSEVIGVQMDIDL